MSHPRDAHSALIDKICTVNLQTTAEPFDAIVIGSGMSGGWAAKELCEKGRKTLVLERGRPVEHGTDYITEHRAPWDTPFRGMEDRQHVQERKFRQSKAGPFNENTAHWYVDDVDNVYQTEDDTEDEFLWVRGYHLGGRSVMWGRQSYRLSPMDFEANAREGRGTPWPVSYDDIEPWYSYVERFAGISGERLGLPQLPDRHRAELPRPDDDHRARGDPDAAAHGAAGLPLLWPLRPRLLGRGLFLVALLDAPGGAGDGQPHRPRQLHRP